MPTGLPGQIVEFSPVTGNNKVRPKGLHFTNGTLIIREEHGDWCAPIDLCLSSLDVGIYIVQMSKSRNGLVDFIFPSINQSAVLMT